MRLICQFTFALFVVSFPVAAKADWESSLLPNAFTHENSLKKAVAAAKRSDKNVIMYYTRTNCPPCTALQRELRNESTASLFRDHYVFTAVWGSSMGQAERDQYRTRYNVQGAPTWLVFSNDGEYICTAHGGFSSAADAKRLHLAAQSMLKVEGGRGSDIARSCS